MPPPPPTYMCIHTILPSVCLSISVVFYVVRSQLFSSSPALISPVNVEINLYKRISNILSFPDLLSDLVMPSDQLCNLFFVAANFLVTSLVLKPKQKISVHTCAIATRAISTLWQPSSVTTFRQTDKRQTRLHIPCVQSIL